MEYSFGHLRSLRDFFSRSARGGAAARRTAGTFLRCVAAPWRSLREIFFLAALAEVRRRGEQPFFLHCSRCVIKYPFTTLMTVTFSQFLRIEELLSILSYLLSIYLSPMRILILFLSIVTT